MSKRGDLTSVPEHVPFPVKDSNNSLDYTGFLFVSLCSFLADADSFCFCCLVF